MMKEFLGIGGYTRPAEGSFSWQHLTFVGFMLTVMVVLAVFFGKHNRNLSEKQKNKVLIWSAFLINGFEIAKIIVALIDDIQAWRHMLPLFLCSLQLIAIPVAAFSKGRIKEAALDFVCIFGILGAVLGTFGATQNYNAYPVLSFTNIVSGITHCISGFASLYVLISGMAEMKRSNLWITCTFLLVFCVIAYVVNLLVDYNYMFLVAHDGTPYVILYDLVGGNEILYPICVVVLFFVYIAIFYGLFHLQVKKKLPVAAKT